MENERTTILVVDDCPSLREILRIYLEPLATDIMEAGHGHEALSLLRQHQVDLVLTDIHMPDMDGITLARTLQQHSPTLPVIAMSALHDPMLIESTFKAGISDYIQKPLNEHEVVARIRRVLQQGKEVHELQAGLATMTERYRRSIEVNLKLQEMLLQRGEEIESAKQKVNHLLQSMSEASMHRSELVQLNATLTQQIAELHHKRTELKHLTQEDNLHPQEAP